KQINEDLASARTLLPDAKYAHPTEKWRVSKGAVIAMQAKTALFNENWQEVITHVNSVEATHFYDLNENYFDSFDVEKEFTEEEVIFCYDHQSAQTPRR